MYPIWRLPDGGPEVDVVAIHDGRAVRLQIAKQVETAGDCVRVGEHTRVRKATALATSAGVCGRFIGVAAS
ncbi:hypothetical protein A5784_32875 [Mycobacterium sp. 852013-50091_SCH5140682]|nr:hypothetical protein A5784_32875 [Mycobacterium sp. 852013-50091_SCH5140682]